MSGPRALIVAYCFPPHGAIGTHRTLRLVQCLSREGWEVDVVTADPAAYMPGTPLDQAFIARIPAGVGVQRTRVWRPIESAISAVRGLTRRSRAVAAASAAPAAAARPSPPPPRRFRDVLHAATSIPDQEVGWAIPAAIRAIAARRPDVVYSSGPPYTGHLAAWLISRVLRRPWVADFRDPWARAPWRTEHQSAGVRFAHGWLEARVVRRASAVVFTTDGARQEFADHYGARLARRFQTVRNGCDVSLFRLQPAARASGVFTLLHAGSLYGGRDPRPLIRAIAAAVRTGDINRDAFRLVFLGSIELDGVDVEHEIQSEGLTGVVSMVPRQPHAQSVRMMQEASALLLVQPGTRLSVPGKLYEYLAVGRPILALADEGETADLITESKAGIVAKPDDEEAIRKALTSLCRNEAAFAPADSALFDGAQRARELERLLRSLAEAPRGRVAAMPARTGHEV